MLSPCLLEILRAYWRILHPSGLWLFPSWRPHLHLTAGAVQTVCRQAWQRSGLSKRVTPHMLRHYAASRTMPPLDVGVPIHGLLSRVDGA